MRHEHCVTRQHHALLEQATAIVQTENKHIAEYY